MLYCPENQGSSPSQGHIQFSRGLRVRVGYTPVTPHTDMQPRSVSQSCVFPEQLGLWWQISDVECDMIDCPTVYTSSIFSASLSTSYHFPYNHNETKRSYERLHQNPVFLDLVIVSEEAEGLTFYLDPMKGRTCLCQRGLPHIMLGPGYI